MIWDLERSFIFIALIFGHADDLIDMERPIYGIYQTAKEKKFFFNRPLSLKASISYQKNTPKFSKNITIRFRDR